MLYLISRQSYINQKNLSDNDQSMTWRLGYDFKHRYMVEFNVAYNGNDRFVGKKKFGWFPAVSVGWNLSEETFFKSAFPFFDLFKLRASYGLVGSDNSLEKIKIQRMSFGKGEVIPGEIRQLRENWCMSMPPGRKNVSLMLVWI